MKGYTLLLACVFITLSQAIFAQCPPPGFPQPGNTCVQAPILCEDLDGYCATINNSNNQQTFPGCPPGQYALHNDEWFAFFAGSTSITIQVTPSNCTQGGNSQGLQGGIYSGCGPPWTVMDVQCQCSETPFTLSANNFVIGQVYWFVLDGCGGDVCDYAIDVLSGSTVGVPPSNPGPLTGPIDVCQGTSSTYSIPPAYAATNYTYTLVPPLGTVTDNGTSANINWGANSSGTAELCVTASNLCYNNPTPACITIEVNPRPTATLSGSGVLCAGSSTPVNLTVTFTGEAPWTFTPRLNGAAQTPITTSENPYTYAVTQPGTYTLQGVTGSSANCAGTVSGSVNVTQTTINLSAQTTNAICGQSNGAVNLSVSNGTAPYMFIWSGGQTTEDLSNVLAGTYTVTVTDANGCTGTLAATVNDTQITLNITGVVVANTTCTGGNGSIDVSVSPTGTYDYLWSNAATTQDLSNLTPGTYTVTVTSGVNCTNTAEFTVPDNPNTPNLSSTVVQTTCDLSNGSINLTVSGGISPYTFQWSPGGEVTEDLNNIPAGSYDVTVTGANGCTSTASINVPNNNPPINVNGSVVANTTCNGGNGSITINVQPPGSYTYIWSNGSTNQNQTGLPPGTYDVTVTGSGSCSQTASFTVPDNPNTPNLNSTVVQTTCDLSNGSINLTVSGGVSPYTFQWSPGGQVTEDLSNIPAGSYDVTVTGANGCTSTASINVPNNNPTINVNGTVIANTTCNGGNGSITINVTPAGSYTFVWSNGAMTQNIGNLTPGTYEVTVNGGGSCTQTASFTVPDNPNTPNINYTAGQTSCDLSNGSINLAVSGGVPPYTFLWSNGAVTQNLANIPSDNYAVTVTGANGCTNTADIFVPNNNPQINVNANIIANTTCNGGNGSITINVTPPGSYTYTWSNGSTSQNQTNLPAGTYEVTVNGGGTCTQTESFTVPDQPNEPTVSFTFVAATCGLSNGSIDLAVFGGVPPYTYQWSSGQTTQDINNLPEDLYLVTVTGANGCSVVDGLVLPNNDVPITINGNVTPKTSCAVNNGAIMLILTPNNLTINWSNGSTALNLNNLAAGDYTVTVSAGGNCTQEATFTVPDETEIPFLDIAITPATCGFSNGALDLEVYTGQAPYTYNWSNTRKTQDISNLASGDYAVTVTTALGCTNVAYAYVPAEDIPIQIFGTVSDNTSCASPNGFIDLDIQPSNLNYTYSWSNGRTTKDISNLTAGTYTVTVTYGNCVASASFDLYNNNAPPNLSIVGIAAICGQTNGGADASVSGGSAPYTYKWSNNALTPDLANIAPGTYTLTVTDFFGCTASAVVAVSNNNIALNISGTPAANTSCTTPNGVIDITVAPTGTYTYAWSNAAVTQDLAALPAGTYTVTVSAGNTCTASATFAVLNNTSDPVITPAVTAAICGQNNGGIDLTISGAPGPFVFAWSNSAVTEDLASILSGNYTVTVTAANGCTADTTLNVANNASTFSLTGLATSLTNCVADNGAINLTVTPAGPYTYVWSNSALTEDISNLPAGTYTVSVTETGTCTASASFIVNDDRTYPAATQTVAAEICGLSNGNIDLSVTGGVTPYSYTWSGGQMSEDLTGIPTGNYAVTVTGANGCTTTASANVPANDISFAISGTPAANTSCIANNGGINLDISPAGTYTFNWSNAASSEDISGLAPGNFTVTVSAGGTCTNTASFAVANNAFPPTISESVTPAFCGQSSGGVNLTVSAGQTPYTFSWSNAAMTEDLTNLPAGMYTVTVTGANGCTAVKMYDVQDDAVTPTVSGIAISNTSCVSSNGAVNLNVSPVLNYTFNWSNNETTQNLQNVAAGVYTVTVNGGGNCINTATFTVDNNSPAPTTAAGITPAFCGQNSGVIDLNVTSGTAPYTYNWSTGVKTEDLAGVNSGTFTVTVSGANGCVSVFSYSVPDSIVIPDIAGTTTPNTLCVGKNGAITIDATPPIGYIYSWSNMQTTQNLVDVPPGTYTVTVNGGGACTATASYVVDNNTAVVAVSGLKTDILCFADLAGAIDLSVSGGTAPYQYKWLPGIPGDPEDPAALAAGNYAVTVTDASGCTGTASFAIAQPASAVQLNCVQSNNVSFPGAGDGAATLTVSGGVGPYTIVWSPGTTQSNVPAGNFVIDQLVEGGYDVTITDANGCTTNCAFNISIIVCETAVGAMNNSLQSLCGEGCISANYSAIGQFLDADDVLQFILHEGAGNQINNEIARSSQPTFCFDPATMTFGKTYYISAAAGNNDGSGNVNISHFCSIISAGTPIVFQQIPVAAIAPPVSISCAVLQVPLAGSSDLPGSTFNWSTQTGVIIGTANQSGMTAGSGGDYSLIVGSNGCFDTTAVQVLDITNDPKATILADPSDVLDCTIDQIILAGVSEGTLDANTVWISNGVVYSTGTVIQIDLPGVYEFVIIDTVTFCSDTALITIDTNQAYPPLFLDPPGKLTCVNKTVTLTGGSPLPGINFVWATISGADTTVLGAGNTFSTTSPGVFYLIGNDPVNHCVNALAVTVDADTDAPVADAGPPFSLYCFGESGNLDGSGSSGAAILSFLWTTSGGNIVSGGNTATPLVSEPGTYFLLVTNPGNGCVDTDEVVITPREPEATTVVKQPACFGEKGSILVENVTGGKPPLQYSLNGGPFSGQNLFTSLDPGTYNIFIIDANDCSTTADVTIEPGDIFDLTLEPKVTVKLGESYQINTDVTVPLNDIQSILWTPATFLNCDTCLNPLATPLQTTLYRLTASNKNGCKDEAPLLLIVDRRPDIYVPNIFSPDGDGKNDIFTIYADTRMVTGIKSFQVFSRWGEAVYEYYNFEPNNPAYGWDGKHRGKELTPAVFTWFAVVEFIDGSELLLEGDVTLKR
jgi:gliding motility-associated-like protein